jgi:cyanophycin synthetase
MITIYDHGAHIPLLWTHLIPAALDGRATFNVQNAMFAAAMAFSMGVRLEDIRHGLRTFTSTFYQAPGRLNVYDGAPVHGALRLRAQRQRRRGARRHGDAHGGARAAAHGAERPGDRRDEDIRATAAPRPPRRFDRYVCRRDDNPRGRGDDEIPRMMAEALVDAGVPRERVEIVVREVDAIERALALAAKGDLVVICADALERGWKQIEEFGGPRPSARAAADDRPSVGDGRAVPHDVGPADDPAPPSRLADAPVTLPPDRDPPGRGRSAGRDGAARGDDLAREGMVRDARGVMLAPDVDD